MVEGVIVGTVREEELNDLFVAPDARGRGVGRALIEGSRKVGRLRGAAWLEYELDV
jgi:GNAT superfamily N-acetyltransferase